MAKGIMAETSTSFPSTGDTKLKTDISQALKQSKAKDSSSPISRETSTSFAPTSSKPDSWVKGGGTGSFDGPDAPSRKKTSYGSGPGN